MTRAVIVAASSLVAVAGVWFLTGAKKSVEKTARDARPRSVLIVPEPRHTAAGTATVKAISVVDRKKIKKLENFFRNYRRLPASDIAAGWKAGYRVYFNFPYGKTICVTLSGNDNGKTWTIGKGDFSTNGDFAGFVKKLEGKSQR